jgi:hypothetical protein
MISIITKTISREYYLKKLLLSMEQLGNVTACDFQHLLIFMGARPTPDMEKFISNLSFASKITTEHWEDVKQDGAAMNILKKKCVFPLTMKMDDDAVMRSPDYFNHVLAINKLVPNAMFSPYPVGLINNPGGVLSKDHSVKYSPDTDTYYIFRKVHHIGGFAKIIPTNLLQQVNFSDGRMEDTETSQFCGRNNIPMYYLENALIVEHQESTLGQHARYGEAYFKGRF